MLNYMMADIKRIMHKKSTYFIVIFFMVFHVLANHITHTDSDPKEMLLVMISYTTVVPLFIGLPIFLSVYADDLKTKSMQVAIGFGISRQKVIFVKIFEAAVLTVIAALLAGIGVTAISMAFGVPFTGAQIGSIALSFAWEAIRTVAYMIMTLPLLYLTQSYVAGNCMYIFFATGVPAQMMNILLTSKVVENFVKDGNDYLLTEALAVQKDALTTGAAIPLYTWVTIGVYLILAILLAIQFFRKKELEF